MMNDDLKINDYLIELDDCIKENLNIQIQREYETQTKYENVSKENKSRVQQNNDRLFNLYKADFEFSMNRAFKTDDFITQEKCYFDMKNVERKIEELLEQEQEQYKFEEEEAKNKYEYAKQQRINAEEEYAIFKKKKIAYELLTAVVIPIGIDLAKKYLPKFISYCGKKLSY